MLTLSLGVLDVAYKDEKASTTGEVAEILEEKYHIMRTFIELHEEFIGDELAKRIIAGLEVGKVSRELPIDAIDNKFRQFLDADEMSKILPASLQSQAAGQGINHRKKRAYVKSNPSRPAFIDTGLYQASFRTLLKA